MHEGLDPTSAARDSGAGLLTWMPSFLVDATASTKQQCVLEVKKGDEDKGGHQGWCLLLVDVFSKRQ